MNAVILGITADIKRTLKAHNDRKRRFPGDYDCQCGYVGDFRELTRYCRQLVKAVAVERKKKGDRSEIPGH